MSTQAASLNAGATHSAQPSSADIRRPDIDGLRGIAVLAVMGFHFFPRQFPGGFVGVDVFFVVSGFLISGIILRELQRSTFSFSDFYARRARRIFPALITVLLACLLFGWIALLPGEYEQLGKHAGAAAAFLSNFVFWREQGYFDVDAELKPLLHLWSLGVEEQFYLLWPFAFLLLWKLEKTILLPVVIALTAASFILALALGQIDTDANFYLPFSRFWELGAGCLLAVAMGARHAAWSPLSWPARLRGLPLLQRLHRYAPAIGIALIGTSIFLLDSATLFPGWATLLPVVGAMCLIVARQDSWMQRNVLASAPLVAIGLISYSLYLWHWPILSFATILGAGTITTQTRVVAVVLSIALAWLTYRYIERPVRARRTLMPAVASAACLAAIGAAAFAMYRGEGVPSRYGVDVRALQPEPRMNDLCRNEVRDGRFNYCRSTAAGRPLAVFLGDSRAQGFYDGVVSELGAEIPMTLLARGGCPPLLDAQIHGAEETGCNETWNDLIEYVRTVRPEVVVVVGGGAFILPGTPRYGDVSGDSPSIEEPEFREGLRRLIAVLQEISPVIYVRQIPVFDSPPSCFLRPFTLLGSGCRPSAARVQVEGWLATYNKIVDQVASEFPSLRVVDTLPLLCSRNACSQKHESGEIIYRDEYHLSPAGGRYFARASGLAHMVLQETNVRSNPTPRNL